MFSAQQEKRLAQPLKPEVIKKRQAFGNSGQTLVYIEGWYAIDTANQIFGYDGWSMETIRLEETSREQGKDRNGNVQWQVSCVATVRVCVGQNGHTITREGTGFGSGFSKLIGDAVEGAYKEAETDALKRALRSFGNQFGNALYDKEFSNVEGTPANRAKQQREAEEDVTPTPPVQASPAEGSDGLSEPSAPKQSLAQMKRDGVFEKFKANLEKCKTEDQARGWFNKPETQARMADWPKMWKDAAHDALEAHCRSFAGVVDAEIEDERSAAELIDDFEGIISGCEDRDEIIAIYEQYQEKPAIRATPMDGKALEAACDRRLEALGGQG